MAKVTRVFQNQFMVNGSASHCGQFGSKALGAPVNTLDPNSIQALSPFVNQGWSDAVVGSNKQPFLEDMNGLFRLAFYQFCSLFQDGIPAWDPSTPYYTGSIARRDGTFELYGSLIDNNVGNVLPAQTNNGFWQYLPSSNMQTIYATGATFNTISSSSYVPTVITGSITPNAGRRVKIDISGVITAPQTGSLALLLYRNGSPTYEGPIVESATGGATQLTVPFSFSIVDTPASGSPVTYQIYAAYSAGALGPAYVGQFGAEWSMVMQECI
jgi:hypothetical protein